MVQFGGSEHTCVGVSTVVCLLRPHREAMQHYMLENGSVSTLHSQRGVLWVQCTAVLAGGSQLVSVSIAVATEPSL